MNLSASIKSKT